MSRKPTTAQIITGINVYVTIKPRALFTISDLMRYFNWPESVRTKVYYHLNRVVGKKVRKLKRDLYQSSIESKLMTWKEIDKLTKEDDYARS